MPTLSGPCVDCGEHASRYMRPGKHLRCFECSLARMGDQIRAMATPGTPERRQAVEGGSAVAAQVREGAGPLYEKWREGMIAYAERLKNTG